MNYQETIDYLYQRLPMFSRVGAAAYKKDLHNTLALLEALGNPHRQFKSIHIAGTNGKGSTSHMLAAILHQAGYKTGLYTSPHLYDFRERIKVSGCDRLEMISKEFVTEFTDSILAHIERIEPSFFEVTVAMAFSWFARQQVDIAVIETGLGGRLDSTNVITPELSIITNIGWDHMNLLGHTLELIAGEKAGIIKNHIPVVIGETLPETLPVFEKKAGECQSTIALAENTWTIEDMAAKNDRLNISFKHQMTGETLVLECDLPGLYQQFNIRTTLNALDALNRQGWNIGREHIQQALARVKPLTGLMGRWQVIGRQPYIVLDVAHNVAGMTQLLMQIHALRPALSFGQVHIILGMVKDKDIDSVLKLLPVSYSYYFTQAALPRALPYTDLQEKASSFGLQGPAFSTPDQALAFARQQANSNDLIVVCGSVFVVAEITLP